MPQIQERFKRDSPLNFILLENWVFTSAEIPLRSPYQAVEELLNPTTHYPTREEKSQDIRTVRDFELLVRTLLYYLPNTMTYKMQMIGWLDLSTAPTA